MKECSRYRSEAGARDEKPSPLRGGRFVRGDEANQSAGRSLSTLYWLAPIPDVVDNTPVATLANKSCTSLIDYPLPVLYVFSHLAALMLPAKRPGLCPLK